MYPKMLKTLGLGQGFSFSPKLQVVGSSPIALQKSKVQLNVTLYSFD